MGTELSKIKSDLPSENNLVKQALQATKINQALPHEIGGVISGAIDKAIFYLGLKTDETDRDLIKLNVIADVKRHFPLLTVDELAIAIDNGVHGKYGTVVGLSPKDVYNWINAYSISNERRENQERLQKELAESNEPTEEEKEQIRWDNLINAWDMYKQNGYFKDFGNSIYNYLDKKGKIKFTVEQKEDFKRIALINLKNEFNPIKYIGNFVMVNDVKRILNEIESDDKNARVIAEAKKVALNQLFSELAEMEMSIEDLFITE